MAPLLVSEGLYQQILSQTTQQFAVPDSMNLLAVEMRTLPIKAGVSLWQALHEEPVAEGASDMLS